MSYEVFQEKVLSYIKPLGLKARFTHENGRHFADISDGTVIKGNSEALSVSVHWGSGHMAIAQL